MQQSMNGAGQARPWATPPSPFAWGAVMVGLAVIGFLIVRAALQPVVGSGSVMPTSPAIEDKWGIRLTQVGVTGDGGLVEVRFVVLDGDKALEAMQEQNIPVLRVENGGAVVRSAALMTNKHEIAPGRSSFLLYRNTDGAIKPGTSLTIAFADERLEHVVAH